MVADDQGGLWRVEGEALTFTIVNSPAHGTLAGIVATAFVTAVAGAIYPAHFASRIEPAEALRYE